MKPEKKRKIAHIYLRERLARKKEVVIPGTGKSMHPLILEGDLLTVRGVTAEEIRSGDIILFDTASGLYCHRAVSTRRIESIPHLVEIGDSRCNPRLIPSEKALGRVVRIHNDRSALDLGGTVMAWAGRMVGLYHRILLKIFSSFERPAVQGPVPVRPTAHTAAYRLVKRMALWPPKLFLRCLIPVMRR
jgi:hypothetical protein